MNRLFALALAPLFALPACVADELTPEDIERVELAVDNDNPFEPDPNCHVPGFDLGSGGIINGRRDVPGWEGSCCGKTLCDNRETCGDDYGKYTVAACADCHYYECIPGASAEPGGDSGGVRPPVYNPPGGGVLQR
jgi:hypothetical protein